MEYIKQKLRVFLSAILATSMILIYSCNDGIEITKINESEYETPVKPIGYLINHEGKREISMSDFRNEGHMDIWLELTKDISENAEVSLTYDPESLNEYNKVHETDYPLFPKDAVSFTEIINIKAGNKKSDKTTVKFMTDPTLETTKTYVIPIKAEIKTGDLTLSETNSKYYIFVKDLTQLPDCEKSTGIKIISCMEVNDTNPLNNLCFTLKKSKKALIDMVILFSANINYDNETDRVYVYNNPNVQHLLDNKEKYIKPLQDRGMKVILGILGNHDRSGIANLSDEVAREFAQELKNICEAYNLDGVFFDDEYSKYQSPPPPGFVRPSSAAASRLCYETKQAMPDKIVSVYVYSRTYSLPAVDGHESGTFVDYGIHDYGGSSDLSSNYPGMPKSRMALYSQEFNRGNIAYEWGLQRLRNDGYGANMIFAMDPLRYNFNWTQMPAMENIARILFDDELVYDGKPYRKDW